MTFKLFCNKLEAIEKTSSRNEISNLLSDIYSTASVEEVKPITYLIQGRVNPKYVQREFSLGEKQLIKALSEFYAVEVMELTKRYNEIGDFGNTAFEFADNHLKSTSNKISELSIQDVFIKLNELQEIEGKDSVQRKLASIQNTLKSLSPIEVKYFFRIILANLGLGLSDKTIIDSLSIMCVKDKGIRDEIELAFGRKCDLGQIASDLKEIEVDDTEQYREYLLAVKIQPGIPVSAKLVEREKGTNEIFERLGKCYIQPKFDGLRCQIHAFGQNDKVCIRLFSRNLEEFTGSFPDIVEEVEKLYEAVGKQDFVIDSEAIGVNLETGKYLQFGETMKRKRKHGVEEYAKNIKIQVHAFDILYLNHDILEEKIEVRMEKLQNLLNKYKGSVLKMSQTDLLENAEEISEVFNKYVDEGLEGIIAKKTGTIYLPGTRNFDWIKLKRSSESSLNDTVDAVVLGYYYGKGARAALGIGGILVGVYDKSTDSYLTLCKVGTGFSEEDFTKYKSDLDKIVLPKGDEQKYCTKIAKQIMPDVWVEPKVTTEIEADEITVSELHSAGLSLRFPRIKKWGRDKLPTQSTTVEELRRMYELRFGK